MLKASVQNVMLRRLSQFAVVASFLVAQMVVAQEGNIHHEGNEWQQETNGTLAAARIVHIKLDAGSVHVEGGAQSGITYEVRTHSYSSSEGEARHGLENYKISAYVRGDTAWIMGEWQGRHMRQFSAEVSVHVPRETELVKIETDGGRVSANGISGRVEAESGGGPINMQDIGGSVTAETGGDSIELNSIGGDVKLETGGGRISITSVKGKLNASTGGGEILLVSVDQNAVLEAGGGNIQVKQCGGGLKVSTGGGNIEIGDVAGPVEVETGGGSIELGSAKGPVRAETGAGRIVLDGVPSARAETGSGAIEAKFVAGGGRGDSTLETGAGDITVYLPENLNITVRASIELANGHNIRSDFPGIHVNTDGGQWGPKTMTADGSLNGGGPMLKVRTTTGDIYFRRAGR